MSFICPVCNCTEYQKELNCIDYTVTKESFDIVSCKTCGLWQTYPCPPPESISKYYQSDDYISHSDKKESFFDKLYHLVRKYNLVQKTNLVKKCVPRGTLLDFGTGTGYFLDSCKKSGFDVIGIEPNDTARNLAIKKGLIVYENLQDLNSVTKKFDVITLWHVLEHLYSPQKYIQDFYNLLNDNGFLILALPNRNSYDADKYKQFWAGYDVPRHLFHFTKKDVINLTKNQFNLVDVYPMYFDAFYVSILSEKYKQSKTPFLKGMINGCYSNLHAMKNGEYSSLIYVLKKV